MNIFFTLYTSIIILFYQNIGLPYSEIENSFLKKDVEIISKIGNDKIVISLFGKENIYSNAQSKLILKDFFKQNSHQNFKYIFKSKEKIESKNNESIFAIANYYTKSESIRITFYFKKIENNYRISKIMFEKE